jgi:hypothetical protein
MDAQDLHDIYEDNAQRNHKQSQRDDNHPVLDPVVFQQNRKPGSGLENLLLSLKDRWYSNLADKSKFSRPDFGQSSSMRILPTPFTAWPLPPRCSLR